MNINEHDLVFILVCHIDHSVLQKRVKNVLGYQSDKIFHFFPNLKLHNLVPEVEFEHEKWLFKSILRSPFEAVSIKTFIWISLLASNDVIVVKLSLVLHSNQPYGAISYFLTSQYTHFNCHSYRRNSANQTLKSRLSLDTQYNTLDIMHIYQNCSKKPIFLLFYACSTLGKRYILRPEVEFWRLMSMLGVNFESIQLLCQLKRTFWTISW